MTNNEVLQFISYLFQFPEADMKKLTIEDLRSTGEHQANNQQVYHQLEAFIGYLQKNSLEDLQKKYVDLFDFNEKTNLYLTYSRLKEERERGKVLVKLKQIYKEEGFIMNDEELPDYFPLVLEFFTIAKTETSLSIFKQFQPMIEEVGEELKELNSPYAKLVEVVLIMMTDKVSKGGAA